MTLKVNVVTPKCFVPNVSNRLEIQTSLQWSTYRKWRMASGMIWCSMSWRVPVENSKNDKGYITKQHYDILAMCSK